MHQSVIAALRNRRNQDFPKPSMNYQSTFMKKFSVALLGASLLCSNSSLAQQLFHSLGCGSGCRVDYYLLKGPYTDGSGLRKVQVREVSTSGGSGGSPMIRRAKQVWILADCNAQTINMSSFTSSGEGASDRGNWQGVNPDGTNYEFEASKIFAKLCR